MPSTTLLYQFSFQVHSHWDDLYHSERYSTAKIWDMAWRKELPLQDAPREVNGHSCLVVKPTTKWQQSHRQTDFLSYSPFCCVVSAVVGPFVSFHWAPQYLFKTETIIWPAAGSIRSSQLPAESFYRNCPSLNHRLLSRGRWTHIQRLVNGQPFCCQVAQPWRVSPTPKLLRNQHPQGSSPLPSAQSRRLRSCKLPTHWSPSQSLVPREPNLTHTLGVSFSSTRVRQWKSAQRMLASAVGEESISGGATRAQAPGHSNRVQGIHRPESVNACNCWPKAQVCGLVLSLVTSEEYRVVVLNLGCKIE